MKRRLEDALAERGPADDRQQVILDVDRARLQSEEFAIDHRGNVITVTIPISTAWECPSERGWAE